MNIGVFDFLPQHGQLRAMSHKLDSSVALSFTQGMDTVTMYLPPNMDDDIIRRRIEGFGVS